ncbi:PREDICTED: striatin-like [Priapulus caudatus]|uniref:Striatin-like n=1 Tax=Priapulus caudatus TaxID=37621 RepID=A0ABM1EMC2_PRICU|nr:PREDICTED: striatin-like [Priapulus caudatus]
MEDVPAAHFPNAGQLQSGPNGMGCGGNRQNDEHFTRPKYSIPGILHFIQYEWGKFELERSHWDVERAELQARIAFLQGERTAQENLKNDLIRRIKMLEYALKQERGKYHKLKYGTDLLQENTMPSLDDHDESLELEPYLPTNGNKPWRQGRQLLRQYLKEIGYTDAIIDVRSSRVRSLLGLSPPESEAGSGREREVAPVAAANGEQSTKRVIDTQGGRRLQGKKTSVGDDRQLLETEAAVLDTFNFLSSENGDTEEEEEEEEEEEAEEEREERLDYIDSDLDETVRASDKRDAGQAPTTAEDVLTVEEDDDLDDDDTEAALAEFDFLTPGSEEGAGRGDAALPSDEWRVDEQLISKMKEQYKSERQSKKKLQRPKRSTLQAMLANLGPDGEIGGPRSAAAAAADDDAIETDDNDAVVKGGGIPYPSSARRGLVAVLGSEDEAFEAALGLGELAGLSVANEADALSYDIATPQEAFRKTWNAKYTLRSHFDGVRALAFHPVEPALVTASEDHTLKLWNLQKTVPAKKAASLDVEPIYTFRGHEGTVLSLAMSPTGEHCYSGGVDATVRCWSIPSSNIDPYDSFDPAVLTETYIAHTDAVWGLALHSMRMQLLSCSADGTVRLWQPQGKDPLLHTYTTPEGDIPTSVDFVRSDPSQMVAAYTSCNAVIYDLETGKPVIELESHAPTDAAGATSINKVVSHPTLPVTITAHEDRHIRFYDNNTGKMVHSMVAHLDAVTSLAVDPNGLYLLSGSHDCSIRLWNLDSKTCIQEITSHRKKFDESIYDVAFHPTKPYIASSGADALAKVFV